MKKMWKLAVVALAALAFVACACTVSGKAEAFAEDLAEAYKAGDQAKLEKIDKEIADYVKDLDEDELKEFTEAYLKKCLELGIKGEFGDEF
jgi:hypothetical protein